MEIGAQHGAVPHHGLGVPYDPRVRLPAGLGAPFAVR
jgi:hypothetical protein